MNVRHKLCLLLVCVYVLVQYWIYYHLYLQGATEHRDVRQTGRWTKVGLEEGGV